MNNKLPTSSSEAPRPRRRRGAAVAAGVALALTAGGIAYGTSSHDPSSVRTNRTTTTTTTTTERDSKNSEKASSEEVQRVYDCMLGDVMVSVASLEGETAEDVLARAVQANLEKKFGAENLDDFQVPDCVSSPNTQAALLLGNQDLAPDQPLPLGTTVMLPNDFTPVVYNR